MTDLVEGTDDASHNPGRPTVTDAAGPANKGGTTNRGTPTAAATNTANRKRNPVTTGIKSSGHYYLFLERSAEQLSLGSAITTADNPHENARSRSARLRDLNDGGGGGI